MKIIKMGVKPSDKIYVSKCRSCKSELEAKKDELETTYDFRDGTYHTARCPVCQDLVYFTEKK